MPVLCAHCAQRSGTVNGQQRADDYLVPFALEELVARLERSCAGPDARLVAEARQSRGRHREQAGVRRRRSHVFSARDVGAEILLRRQGWVVPKKNVEDHIFGLSGEVASNAVESTVAAAAAREHQARSSSTPFAASAI